MSDVRKSLPAARLILIAAVAGAIVGAIAVYLSRTPSGNDSATTSMASAATDDQACAANAGSAKAIGEAAVGDVAAMLPADPPQSLKNLSFIGPDGNAMTIADHAGKTLLVNIWATWCAPCRAEMPALDALQQEMGSDRFEVVAINVDTGDAGKPKKFLDEIGVKTLASYRDPTMGVFNDLKKKALALGLPVSLLVDPKGCLMANMNGPAEWASDDAKRLVETALGG